MNKIQGIAEIKTSDSGERIFTAKITTNDIDRDGEVLLPQGMDAKDFRRTPVVFWHHDYTMPIGTSMELKRADNHWTATAKIASTPFAQEVYTLMKEGVVRGVSVGFQPTESRPPSKKDLDMFGESVKRVYSKWKLMEFSVTPMPANQNALIMSVSKGITTRDRIKSLFGVDVPTAAPQVKRVVYFCPTVKAVAFDTEALVKRVAAEVMAKITGRPYV
jgi:HK97 family phage prohead protease